MVLQEMQYLLGPEPQSKGFCLLTTYSLPFLWQQALLIL
jgi:hypothetical protein